MIIKKGQQWEVRSTSGKSLGVYKTKQEALKRLRQIEYYKYKGEK